MAHVVVLNWEKPSDLRAEVRILGEIVSCLRGWSLENTV